MYLDIYMSNSIYTEVVNDKPISDVAAALAAIRRRQRRGVLAASAGLDPAGLDANAILVLDAASEGDCTVSDVAELLAVDQPRASRIVARAIDQRWLRREADQADGRRSLLRVTTSGRSVLHQVRARREATVAHAMRGW